MVFNVIILLYVNNSKHFLWFTNCLMIGVLIHPWNHGRTNALSLDIFNNSIYMYVYMYTIYGIDSLVANLFDDDIGVLRNLRSVSIDHKL